MCKGTRQSPWDFRKHTAALPGRQWLPGWSVGERGALIVTLQLKAASQAVTASGALSSLAQVGHRVFFLFFFCQGPQGQPTLPKAPRLPSSIKAPSTNEPGKQTHPISPSCTWTLSLSLCAVSCGARSPLEKRGQRPQHPLLGSSSAPRSQQHLHRTTGVPACLKSSRESEVSQIPTLSKPFGEGAPPFIITNHLVLHTRQP